MTLTLKIFIRHDHLAYILASVTFTDITCSFANQPFWLKYFGNVAALARWLLNNKFPPDSARKIIHKAEQLGTIIGEWELIHPFADYRSVGYTTSTNN